VVATGGIAAKVVPHCSHEIVYDENLLLRGLGIIYRKNRK
jgi:type III pantothenate kinase